MLKRSCNKWASSIHLVKVPSGFEAVIQIPWEQKIKYKFIVDGEWRLHEDQPTEVDPGGFVNNIYTAPAEPVLLPALETSSLPVEAEKPTAAKANNRRTNGVSVVSEVVDKPEYAPQVLPKHDQSLTGTDGKIVGGAELNTPDPSGFAHLLSDIAPREGVSSALAYIAPSLGAAIPTPKSNDNPDLSPGTSTTSPTMVEESTPHSPPSPVAPLVPVMIVPVNAAENNTVASSPSAESMHTLPLAPEPSTLKITPPLISDIAPAVESAVPDEKTNGRSSDPSVVNTLHIQSVVEERTIGGLAPIINTLPTSEAVTPESASEQAPIPVIEPPVNVEAGLVSTSSAMVVTGVPASSSPGVVVEESNEKASPSLVPEVKDVQKAAAILSVITPESHAVDAGVVTERKVAEPIATLTVPATPFKTTPTTSSVQDIQYSPSSQITENSPTSSKFNSVRKKRTSIFGKIKQIFHHNKEKEVK